MGKIKELGGRRFGSLMVSEFVGLNNHRKAVWRCRCDCGQEVNVSGNNLASGNTRSCGCLPHWADLAGERFGKLVAVSPTEKRKRYNVIWKCDCDCGGVAEIVAGALTSGHTKSCGCLLREVRASEAIDISGQRFGSLQAIRISGRGRTVDWECLCVCGRVHIVPGSELRRGTTGSCGCAIRRRADFRRRHLAEAGVDSPEHQKAVRQSNEYREWRSLVFEQDDYTCRLCGESGFRLNAHHIKSFAKYPADRFETDNGLTFCLDCHRGVHSKYGRMLDGTEDYLEELV